MNNAREKAELFSVIIDNLIEDYERIREQLKTLRTEDEKFVLNTLTKKYVLELTIASIDNYNTFGGIE
jgi:hypothetical protein